MVRKQVRQRKEKGKLRSLKDKHGGLFALLSSMVLIVSGALLFIVFDLVLNGSSANPDSGLFDVFQNDLGISTNNTTFRIVDLGWKVTPIALMAAGLIGVIVNSQRREFEEVQFAPRRV